MKFSSAIQVATLLSVAQHAAAAVYDVGVKFDYAEKFTGSKRCALLSVVMDESGSMSGEQSFMKNTAVPEIIKKTKAKGFDHVFLCAYGYGSSFYGDNGRGDARWHGCSDGFDASVMSFVASGSFEDSFEAMTWTMKNFPATLDGVDPHAECSGLAKNMILVTDEDSDHSTYSGVIKHTIDTTIATAKAYDWVINIICDCDMENGKGKDLIGASAKKGKVLMFKQKGTDYTKKTETSTLKATVVSGEGASAEDYPPVTEATGGAIWDIGKLRNTNSAKAFTKAFIDMKVEEITTNPHVPPVVGGSSGDPHVKLWNGTNYDFHGACDLVLMKSDDIDINIRTKQHTWWSYIETAAVRIGGDIFELQGGDNKATYWVNGAESELKEVGLSGYLAETVGGYKVHYNSVSNKQKDFRMDLGNGDWITMQTFNDFVAVRVKTGQKESSRFAGAIGIMGQFPTGKMLSRAGKVVEDTDEFAKGWQVLASEDMLFHNVGGVQHPEECVMPSTNMESMKRRLGESRISEEDAGLACARVAEQDRDACIFDVLATNDVDMAGSY